jgi:predicted 3-demethylubiquinone-9 3-methyltransferase (glyoxalase superfamily)
MKTIHPFLMFQGGLAEEAMNFYAGLFPRAAIVEVNRYGPGEQGADGSVKTAKFTLGSLTVMCIDSPVKHAFDFTPSFSFFVECESEHELRRLSAGLSEQGEALMPLDNYGFSRLFTWMKDRFGVSWQLNLS